MPPPSIGASEHQVDQSAVSLWCPDRYQAGVSQPCLGQIGVVGWTGLGGIQRPPGRCDRMTLLSDLFLVITKLGGYMVLGTPRGLRENALHRVAVSKAMQPQHKSRSGARCPGSLLDGCAYGHRRKLAGVPGAGWGISGRKGGALASRPPAWTQKSTGVSSLPTHTHRVLCALCPPDVVTQMLVAAPWHPLLGALFFSHPFPSLLSAPASVSLQGKWVPSRNSLSPTQGESGALSVHPVGAAGRSHVGCLWGHGPWE